MASLVYDEAELLVTVNGREWEACRHKGKRWSKRRKGRMGRIEEREKDRRVLLRMDRMIRGRQGDEDKKRKEQVKETEDPEGRERSRAGVKAGRSDTTREKTD